MKGVAWTLVALLLAGCDVSVDGKVTVNKQKAVEEHSPNLWEDAVVADTIFSHPVTRFRRRPR